MDGVTGKRGFGREVRALSADATQPSWWGGSTTRTTTTAECGYSHWLGNPAQGTLRTWTAVAGDGQAVVSFTPPCVEWWCNRLAAAPSQRSPAGLRSATGTGQSDHGFGPVRRDELHVHGCRDEQRGNRACLGGLEPGHPGRARSTPAVVVVVVGGGGGSIPDLALTVSGPADQPWWPGDLFLCRLGSQRGRRERHPLVRRFRRVRRPPASSDRAGCPTGGHGRLQPRLPLRDARRARTVVLTLSSAGQATVRTTV